jgi:hypothetical protein
MCVSVCVCVLTCVCFVLQTGLQTVHKHVQLLIITLLFHILLLLQPLQIMSTYAHLRKPMHNLRSCARANSIRSCARANSNDLHMYVVTHSHHMCACAFGYY